LIRVWYTRELKISHVTKNEKRCPKFRFCNELPRLEKYGGLDYPGERSDFNTFDDSLKCALICFIRDKIALIAPDCTAVFEVWKEILI